MSDDIEVRLGASTGDLERGMHEASTLVKESLETMNGHFERLTQTMEHVNGAFLAFGAVLAGGAAFKEAIDESIKFTGEAVSMAKQLGITTEQASTLNVALDDIHSSTEQFQGAASKLTRQVNQNEEALNKMGLKTRDANGELSNSQDLMLDAIKVLNGYKEGTDRNIAAQQLFGRGAGDIANLLKLNSGVIDEVKEKQEALGLVVGEKSVEASKNYKAAMNDVHDVIEGVMKAIGDALMPVMTELGNWFATTGPTLVTIFKGSIGGLIALFHGLVLAVQIVVDVVSGGFKNMIEIGQTFGTVMYKVFHGDFKGAIDSAKDGMKKMQENASATFDAIIKDAEDAQNKIVNLFTGDSGGATKVGNQGTEGADTKKKKGKTGKDDLVAQWKEQLTNHLETEKEYFKSSLQEEIAFWQEKLNIQNISAKDRRAVEHELYALHKKEAQDDLATEIESLKAKADAYQAGGTERIRIADEIAHKISDKYGTESKEYQKALIEVEKATLEHQKQLIKLDEMRIDAKKSHDLITIDMESDKIKTLKDLNEITEADELTRLKKLEEDKYQIELQAAQDRAALITNDVVAQQAAYDKIEELTLKHNQDMAKMSDQIVIAQKDQYQKMLEPISSAFDKSITGMIQGTQTLQKSLSNIFQSIVAEFVSTHVKKMVASWATGEATKTSATVAGNAARTASDVTASTMSIGAGAMAAIKNILNSAYETFAAIYKAIAGIPFVGPAMAPGMAAAGMGVVAGMAGSIASASGGFDIPSGMNPMTQLHQKEMVLPAKYADPMREMLANGGGNNAPIHIHATDGDYLHKDDVAAMLKKMNRNFVFDNTPLKRRY